MEGGQPESLQKKEGQAWELHSLTACWPPQISYPSPQPEARCIVSLSLFPGSSPAFSTDPEALLFWNDIMLTGNPAADPWDPTLCAPLALPRQ